MTSSIISRAVAAHFEVRAGGEGRTLAGIAVPYDTPTTINDWLSTYTETFRQGAFRNAIADPRAVKLLSQHDRFSNPIGRADVLREDNAGLYAEFLVSKTQLGDETLELARDGILSFSIGFIPIEPAPTMWEEDGANVVRTLVDLREVSTVTWPAYEGAKITGVRSSVMVDALRAAGYDGGELERLYGAMQLAREGRTLSADTQNKLREAMSHMGNASDVLAGMLPDDAAGGDSGDPVDDERALAEIKRKIRVMRMRQKIIEKGLNAGR